MATYPPPNFIEPLDEFNTSNWITNATAVGFTPDQIAYLNAKYLKFPVAQGLETLQEIIVNGTASFNNIVSPISLATQPLANDSSTKMPTTAWVQTAISGATNLLTSNNTWTGTNDFTNVALPTTTGTLPASNTISTQIPTMDWSQQAITGGINNLLANINTWTGGSNTFNNDATFAGTNFLYTGSIQGPQNNNNYVSTNQWVQSAIAYSQSVAGTYAGLQETLIYSEIPYNYSSLGSITGNALYNYNPSALSFAVSKSFNTTGYSATDSVYVCFNPTNPIASLGQNTQLFLTPPPQSSFEPCVLAFSADGQYAIATSDTYATNPAEVYVMSKSQGNSGTFNAVQGGAFYKFINDACLSADGQYQLLAEVSGSDTMYLSVDYGASFNSCATNGVWFSCAMSATGKYQMGISQYQYIANSSDYGVNWNYTNFSSNSFLKCCMSANGQYQFVISNAGGMPDSAFISIDYGANWINIDSQIGAQKLWVECCMTDCGRVMIGYENTGGGYYSLDYGKTWTATAFATFLNGASKPTFCVNGKYLIGQKSGSLPYYTQFSAIF